ncbi:MAG: hypothetical protein AB7F98_08610 [Novosphingobium sp.]
MEAAAEPVTAIAVENALRDELAQGDAMLATTTPILRQLAGNGGNSMFGDDILASVRGMAGDLARQMLDALAQADGSAERAEHEPAALTSLTGAFMDNSALLSHLHALALEWQLTCRLQARLSLDPVLTPLLQTLIASNEPEIAALAMQLLAAQARFGQSQRRMQLPLVELPGDLLHTVVLALRAHAGEDPEADRRATVAETKIRTRFDESASRLGLTAKLLNGMGAGAVAALSVTHGGVAMFLTALGLASGQSRDLTVLTTGESQVARLALALLAAGLKPQSVEKEFFSLHPDVALPSGFERIGADSAAAILALAGSPVAA